MIKNELQYLAFFMAVTMVLVGWIGYSLHRIAKSLKHKNTPQ